MLSPGLGLGHNTLETNSHPNRGLGEAAHFMVTRMGAVQISRTPVCDSP